MFPRAEARSSRSVGTAPASAVVGDTVRDMPFSLSGQCYHMAKSWLFDSKLQWSLLPSISRVWYSGV